jgi:hypothetical protein
MKEESKTKKCNWCGKRKPTNQTYHIDNKGKRQIRICVECNLIKDII